MGLQKHKDSNKISFLNKKVESKTEETTVKEENNPQLKPAQKSDNSSAIDNRAGSILSAGKGSVSDFGGPSKYVGSQTSNSIWDSNVIENLASVKDSGEKIKEENIQTKEKRKAIKEERLEDMTKSLQETDMRKSNGVSNSGEFKGSKYNMPQNNISIFDNAEFERVPEKTEGEKIAEKETTKDDSWKNLKGTTKTNDYLNKLFDK